MSFIDPSVIKPFNVVLDAGSGMGGLVAPKLFDRLPCKTTRLCFEVDGRFPNHEANPLIEANRRDIVARVVGPIGGDVFKAWHLAMFGKECGCGDRQEALNARYPIPRQDHPAPPGWRRPSRHRTTRRRTSS